MIHCHSYGPTLFTLHNMPPNISGVCNFDPPYLDHEKVGRAPIQEVCRARILGLYWGYMGIMEKEMEATI